MIYNFYDTCSLLLAVDRLFNPEDESQVVFSSITLKELEEIKTSKNKDADVKYSARKLLHKLQDYSNSYQVVVFQNHMLDDIAEYDLPISDDTRILSCAYNFYKNLSSNDTIYFISNDLAFSHIASLLLPIGQIISIDEECLDDYNGVYDISLNEDEMIEFYSHPDVNYYDLMINQYIIVRNSDGEVVDKLCWTGEGYRPLTFGNFDSRQFGKIKPLKDDPYQSLVADSFLNNPITMVRGSAGSGKTFLSLAFLLNQLERGRIDKIIVFCNTVATKNSAKLGYYPGDKNDKLLDSQIGNLLSSKLGGRLAVEQMIDSEKLVLLPLSDIRGYDTSGMNAGIYISEAQNMDITLMKLALQRIGDDSICIIDGDDQTQVDDIAYAGANNGMRRLSKVFRDHDIYGEVELQQIHRSKIAELAQLM